MNAKIKQLVSQMEAKWGEIRTLREKVVAESRDFTPDEIGTIEKGLDFCGGIEKQIDEERKNENLMDQIDALGKGLEKYQADGQPAGNGRGAGRKSLGQRFTEDQAWKAWMKSISANGTIPERIKLTSPAILMKDFNLFRKELITGLADDSAGAFVVAEDTGIYEPIGRYAVTLRNLISVRTTGSDTVEFVRQTKQVTEAAPTPESNVKYPQGYPGEITGEKPQGEVHWERVHETVKTIAIYVGATKRALADVGQLRGLIDGELRADLVDELENQLFNGNGVGENFTGLVNQPNTLQQAFNTNALITARQAITTLLVVGRQMPTAFSFHPTDWEAVDILRDLNGAFLRGSPFGNGPTTLWGVPVSQSFHQATGSFWLANWRKAVLWDREQATITATDSHEDWFIRNMIAILAEMRAAFGLVRPSAFVNGLLQ